MQITGKSFIVTGAGSGLGGAVARMLVDAGGKVLIVDVNKEAGQTAAAALGANALFVAADVTSEADGKAALAAALQHFGGLTASSIAPASRLGRKSSARKARTASKVSRAR